MEEARWSAWSNLALGQPHASVGILRLRSAHPVVKNDYRPTVRSTKKPKSGIGRVNRVEKLVFVPPWTEAGLYEAAVGQPVRCQSSNTGV